MTPEQTYQLLFIIATSVAGFFGAWGIWLKSKGNIAELQAKVDFDENTTQGNTIKLITDRYARKDDENSDLQTKLRESAIRETEKDGTIKELRVMVHELGERNRIQGEMMHQLAGVMKTQKELIQTQTMRIAQLETSADHKSNNKKEDKPP